MTNVVLEQLAPEKEGENNSAIQYVVPEIFDNRDWSIVYDHSGDISSIYSTLGVLKFQLLLFYTILSFFIFLYGKYQMSSWYLVVVPTWICCSCRSRHRPSFAEGHSEPGRPLQEPGNHHRDFERGTIIEKGTISLSAHHTFTLLNQVVVQQEHGLNQAAVRTWNFSAACGSLGFLSGILDAPASPEHRNGI